jgi:hypothetical protein
MSSMASPIDWPRCQSVQCSSNSKFMFRGTLITMPVRDTSPNEGHCWRWSISTDMGCGPLPVYTFLGTKMTAPLQNCYCNLIRSTIPWHKSISGPPGWTSNEFPSKDVSKSSTFHLMDVKWATVLLNRFKELIKNTWLRVSNGLHPFKYNYFFSAETNIAQTQVFH